MKSPKKILIVDDNRVVLKTTAFKLRSFGYEVHTAEDGGGAIAQLRDVQPDLLLLDLNFPPDIAHGGGVPWDGLLLLSWIRRMNELRHMQVIVITGGNLPHYQERCLEAGVLDIALKPIDHEALIATIRRALKEAPRVQEPASPSARQDSKRERKPEARKAKPHPQAPIAVRGARYSRLEPEAQPESPQSFQPEPDQEAESAGNKKILFVDDESDWRYMGELYLTECGYEVITTADAVGALTQASIRSPHLVVLDLHLGGGSGGVTLLKLLAQAHPKMPILIYTGQELDNDEVSKLQDEGACECLRKGTMEELLNAVARAIGRGTSQAGLRAGAAGDPRASDPAREQTAEEAATVGERAMDAAPEETEAPPGQTGGQGALSWAVEESVSSPGGGMDAAPRETEAVAEPSGESAHEGIESRGQLVLVVTENTELGNTLRSSLEPNFFSVTCVIDGTEALSQVRTAEIDFIVFDLTVSSLRVDEFYQALEGIKPELRQRMIFITNDDVHPTLDAFVRRVRGLMLWQPFGLDELLHAARTFPKLQCTEKV